MPLLIDHPKHRYRSYLLSYDQARVVLYCLAATAGMLSTTQEPQLLQLRADARALHDLLRAYHWQRGAPP